MRAWYMLTYGSLYRMGTTLASLHGLHLKLRENGRGITKGGNQGGGGFLLGPSLCLLVVCWRGCYEQHPS